jgi:hypothetical protein
VSRARGLGDAARRGLLRDLVATGGAWVTCAGRSMEPTIRLGDRVRIEPCARGRTGEVVLFEATRGHVLHRVVLALPGLPWFLHLGDAGSGDGPGLAHVSRVVGRARLPRRRPPLPVLLAAGWRLACKGRDALRRRYRRAGGQRA